MTAELRSINSGPIRRALDRLDRRVTEVDGGGASSPNPNNARGVVGVGSFTPVNPLVPANTLTQITANLSVTMLTGRRYRVFVGIRAANATVALGMNTFLRDGTTKFPLDGTAPWIAIPASSAGLGYPTCEWLLNGDGVTRSLNIAVQAAGNVQLYSDYQSYFYVEDVGPNQAPALPIPATPPAWTPLTLSGTWVNFGTFGGSAAYRKIGDEVTVRGFVKNATSQAGSSAIAVLPAGFRPVNHQVYPCIGAVGGTGNQVAYRVDARSDGELRWQGTAGTVDNLSLDTIRFSTTA